MRGARGMRLPCRPPSSHNAQSGIRFQGRDKQKQPEGLSLRLSVRNRRFREATALPKAARNSPSAYLTGAFTGGGKGSA